MEANNEINDGDNRLSDEDRSTAIEIRRIKLLLENQVRRAECGSIVQISKCDILEPESCEMMRGDWIYGLISNEADYCEDTGCVAYQINWCTAHLHTHNSFLSLVAPVFEIDFTVLKWPEDEHDDNDDVELRRLFGKLNGEWCIVEYGGYTCEFCDETMCDRAQYGDELDSMVQEVIEMSLPANQSRYSMYRQFTHLRYGTLGSGVRKELCDCVQDLIMQEFPVTAGTTRRGFVAVVNDE